MKSGIYKIVNKKNGKFYIGSSIDIKRRWREHLSHLRTEKHKGTILLRAWKKYGEESFEFEVVEKVEDLLLIEREQYYIDTLNPEYNTARIAGSSLGCKRTEEQIMNSLKGRGKKLFRAYTKDKELIGEWLSKTKCVKELGLKSHGNISTCLKERRGRLKGLFFVYADDIESLDEIIKNSEHKSSKKFSAWDKEGNYAGSWENGMTCKKDLGLNSHKCINKCLRGISKSYRGYRFKYD